MAAASGIVKAITFVKVDDFPQLRVSSSAIVVDLYLKDEPYDVRGKDAVDDTKVPAANADGEAVDSSGETWAVLIDVKKSSYKQAAIRMATTVTTKKVLATNT